jgi:hypothetical protein
MAAKVFNDIAKLVGLIGDESVDELEQDADQTAHHFDALARTLTNWAETLSMMAEEARQWLREQQEA